MNLQVREQAQVLSYETPKQSPYPKHLKVRRYTTNNIKNINVARIMTVSNQTHFSKSIQISDCNFKVYLMMLYNE